MISFEDLDTVNEVKSEKELLLEIESLKSQVALLQQQIDESDDIETQFARAESCVRELERKGNATPQEIRSAKVNIEAAYSKILLYQKTKKELDSLQAQVAVYISQVAELAGACLE